METHELPNMDAHEMYYAKVKRLKAVLVVVTDPQQIQKGSVEIDIELAKLAKNLEVYTRLSIHAGSRLALLDKEYAEKYLQAFASWTDDRLESVTANRGHKEKLVKAELREQQYQIDDTKNALIYFNRMQECCIQWMNIYKKLRGEP